MKTTAVIIFSFIWASASAYKLFNVPNILNRTIEADNRNELEGRITNGVPAAPGQFPYQVGLVLNHGAKNAWCGGSLIGQNWVLTAAHCTKDAQYITVYLGTTKLVSGRYTFLVEKEGFYQHAGYDSVKKINDIALIKIPTVPYTNDIEPIKLPSMSSAIPDYANSYAFTSGWGRTSDTSSLSDDLNYARLQILSNVQCMEFWGDRIEAGQICVSTKDLESPCNGDSGGPLVLENEKILVGVVSFGSSFGCTQRIPGVYARVSAYLDWIKERTGISY